ncbi:MAG: DUF2071 domain-containing protein [Microbacterium sp.]|uniref:DUF2071 domain-containing protein n=1 Tax=Microbacterium sp. TaxID=51671 RepID=UPI001AC47BCE|nr:DUF2071 domain-containing protein [Microbacterium sp.]MBN9155315.1 DUF2071 domain-containing protein [Microbacterium sp.]
MNADITSVTLPLEGTIERRLLVTYRLDPAVARPLLPTGLRPHIVDGSAVAGICLIRLGHVRPAWAPSGFGLRTENAAHRIAVEWDEASGVRTGVYIPQRHSASWLPVAAGGRVFPGVHRRARFDILESADRIRVRMTASDTRIVADVALTEGWASSLFPTLDHASEFFRTGSVGWSPARDGRTLEGLHLETDRWEVAAGLPLTVASSYFDSLPAGAATLDHVLVMRDIPMRWTRPATAASLARGR